MSAEQREPYLIAVVELLCEALRAETPDELERVKLALRKVWNEMRAADDNVVPFGKG